MNYPNIFSYATSELSQDAFICWILSWAAPEYEKSDDGLYKCANKFISIFFKKHGICMPSKVEKIEIRKQANYIDVLCILNSKYAIVIEDKIRTKNRLNQLKKNIESAKELGYEKQNIIPIYYKTEDQSNYLDIYKDGYQTLLREEIVSVLSEYSGNNAILLDYREHLQSITYKVESYKDKKISDWDRYSWIGFYRELQAQLGDGDWSYVSNPAGGFLGFWWFRQESDEC
ncbi:MAG: hypothetical protein OEW87_15110, partial [Flavobacteriaceae bacterium]|nr:hypothetical protein [Flavobacteriaceae bacterium]